MVGAFLSAGRQRDPVDRARARGGVGGATRAFAGARRGRGEPPSRSRGPRLSTGRRARPERERQRGVRQRDVTRVWCGVGAAGLPRGQVLLPLARLGAEVAQSCGGDAGGTRR